MDAQQFQTIKDQAYLKIQERLMVTPSIKEELTKKFATWFQGLVAAHKQMQAAQQQPPQGQPQTGTPHPQGQQ